MKKYPVSKFYTGSNIFGLFLVLGCEAFIIWLPGDTHCIEYYIIHAAGISSIIYILYTILTDLPTAKFSFSEEGITMYVGFKKYETPWSGFVSAGLLMKDPDKYYRGIPDDTMWVYFSKTYLTEKEIGCFLYKTRKDLNRIAYFQCEERLLRMVMEKLPDNLREDLEFYLSFQS